MSAGGLISVMPEHTLFPLDLSPLSGYAQCESKTVCDCAYDVLAKVHVLLEFLSAKLKDADWQKLN